MDRQQLRSVLAHEGVNPQAYALDTKPADTADDTYAIDPYGFGWRVYYKADGCSVRERTFGSEDEACEHLLNLVLRDPHTRIPRQQRAS